MFPVRPRSVWRIGAPPAPAGPAAAAGAAPRHVGPRLRLPQPRAPRSRRHRRSNFVPGRARGARHARGTCSEPRASLPAPALERARPSNPFGAPLEPSPLRSRGHSPANASAPASAANGSAFSTRAPPAGRCRGMRGKNNHSFNATWVVLCAGGTRTRGISRGGRTTRYWRLLRGRAGTRSTGCRGRGTGWGAGPRAMHCRDFSQE